MVFFGVVNKEKWPESLDRLCVAWKYTWHQHSVMSCNAINPMALIRGNTTLDTSYDTSYDTSRSDYPTMGLWRICLPLSLNFIAFAFLWWKHRKALKAKPAVFKKIGHVAGIFIYPVKSCRGISIEASNCLIEGLQNDRYVVLFVRKKVSYNVFVKHIRGMSQVFQCIYCREVTRARLGHITQNKIFQRMIFQCALPYRSEDCTVCLANRTASSTYFSTRRGSTPASTVFLIGQIFHDRRAGSQLYDKL